MKKLLILCQNYPSQENPFSQPFVHYRLREYLPFFDVTVLSFASRDDYEYEGVKVFSEKSAKEIFNNTSYDLVISHAPNVRNHQRFLLTNIFKIKKLLFIFHGYEVINIHKRVYNQKTHFDFPSQYSFLSKFYHSIKLPITCLFLKFVNRLTKCCFIFVSNSLLNEASEDLSCNILKKGFNTFIINNPIDNKFFKAKYASKARFDHVCIRPFHDPKYGIDIFIKLAENHPDKTFHLFGAGQLPKFAIPKNLTIFHKFLKSDEIIETLKNYKSAVLPTRWDSQGVLACEIAATGMPLYTSDLSVCREMLSNYENVTFCPNDQFHLIKLENEVPYYPIKEKHLFSHSNTTHKEISLVKNLFESQDTV